MSFRLLFRTLHFLALVFATISLVCFGVQEKIVGKNSCFGVSWFSKERHAWQSGQESGNDNHRRLLPYTEVIQTDITRGEVAARLIS